MTYRCFFSMLVLATAMLAAMAQPSPDDCWLTVRALTADGAPFPVAPAVQVSRLEGGKRAYVPARPVSKANDTCLFGLQPGKYELTAQFIPYGLFDGPVEIEIIAGFNHYDWRMPPVTPVSGDLLMDGKPTTVKKARAYLMKEKSWPRAALCTPVGARYQLFGVFPGKYRLLVMTDTGYGTTEFTAAMDQKDGVKAPITLQAGSPLSVTVSSADEKGTEVPVNYAGVVLTRAVEKGFSVSVILYTDPTGKVATLALPPGEWRWAVSYAGYERATGTVTVIAGANPPLAVVLKPAKK
ncbi:MAG: carboxypeptidase-like regulatory domain-containing protein [Armatimonadota bacterium]